MPEHAHAKRGVKIHGGKQIVRPDGGSKGAAAGQAAERLAAFIDGQTAGDGQRRRRQDADQDGPWNPPHHQDGGDQNPQQRQPR